MLSTGKVWKPVINASAKASFDQEVALKYPSPQKRNQDFLQEKADSMSVGETVQMSLRNFVILDTEEAAVTTRIMSEDSGTKAKILHFPKMGTFELQKA